MTRKYARVIKIGSITTFILLFFNVFHKPSCECDNIVPHCIRGGGDSQNCEHELLLALPKIIEKITELNSLLPRDDYKSLWDIQVSVSKIISREQRRRRERNNNKLKTLKYSCVETYNGSTYGYPFFIEGFVKSPCNKPPLSQSTSIIIDRPVIERNALVRMLEFAVQTFHQVFVIVKKVSEEFVRDVIGLISRGHGNGHVVQMMVIDGDYNLGYTLNRIVRLVWSPYLLIGSHLGKLDNSTDIDRLINVQEKSGAEIIASAVKDIHNGVWDRGCYQSEIHSYTLKYTIGYQSSENECMHCSHIVGPFITRTDFLRKTRFNEYLDAGVYRDLFLRLTEPKTVISCPDVLFYTTAHRENDGELVKFAKKWDVSKIIEADGTVRWFGRRVGLAHSVSNPDCSDFKGTLMVPPDCRANLLDAIHFILDLCKKHSLLCELQEGTLLGAVKFNHILPWERDADLTILSAHFDVLRNLSDVIKAQGYITEVVAKPTCCFEGMITGGIMKVFAHAWMIEIYGQHKLTTTSSVRTKILLGDHWVYTPENPGLYVRNRYGKEVYRHAEHWLVSGKDTGWSLYDSGYFQKCSVQGHHGCLDQYRADGDVQFRRWF